MTRSLFVFLVVLSVCLSVVGQSSESDIMLDVGQDRLHFHIVKGKGIPILFEAGGGDDGSVWNQILTPISEITGTTLITYDRAGFGKSEIIGKDPDVDKHGILNGIEDLENGLKQLGYDGNIILVAHSYGGFYAELYASRHPNVVKAVVLIDANHVCWYSDAYTAKMMEDLQPEIARLKTDNAGKYYQFVNFAKTVEVMKRASFPTSIPTVDLVSDNPPFDDTSDRDRWKACHKAFADAAPNREGIVAYGSGHYIFTENPPLVVGAIVKTYSSLTDGPRRDEVLQRAMSYALVAANDSKRQETVYRHSEDDLNAWGYELLRQGEIQKAVHVFELNIELHPTSWGVYDSCGEALLKAGEKEEAIKMYKKSMELNPKSEHGKAVLEQLAITP